MKDKESGRNLDQAGIMSLYPKIKVTEHLQTNDRPNIQTYALCMFTFSLHTQLYSP